MALGVYNSAAFTSASGVAVAANADITVRRESDAGLAAIFSDRAGSSAITQPGFQADATGRFTFYAAGIAQGYEITVTKGAESWTLNNVPIGLAPEFDVDEFWRAVLATATKQAARDAQGIMGAPTDAKIPVGDGTDFRAIAALGGAALLNGYIDWTVAGNVLTIAVKTAAGADPSATDPVFFAVRSATPGTGSLTWVKLAAALSLSINDTATLGTINSTAFRLWAVGFLDGATPRLGVINCLAGTAPNFSIFPLGAWGIASATLEDNASDSAHVFYADAAITDKAYATLGNASWETGLATAGTWSAGPTRKQLFGLGVSLPGVVVQQVREQTGAVATGTATTPYDDSIPQNTEGTEFLDVSITPISAANLLDISAQVIVSNSGASGTYACALFRDATANALAASGRTYRNAGDLDHIPVLHQERAGSVAATVFDVRVGSSAAGTVTFNGAASGRLLGGVHASYLKAEEIMA